jgi:hypothetical protein
VEILLSLTGMAAVLRFTLEDTEVAAAFSAEILLETFAWVIIGTFSLTAFFTSSSAYYFF